MRSTRPWIARLGWVGLLAAGLSGCGGSSDQESVVIADSPAEGAGGAAAPPAPVAATDEAAPAAAATTAVADNDPGPAPAPAAEAEEPAAPVAKGDASATNEMIGLGGSAVPAADAPPPGTPGSETATASAPGDQPNAGGGERKLGSLSPTGASGYPGAGGTSSGYPGSSGSSSAPPGYPGAGGGNSGYPGAGGRNSGYPGTAGGAASQGGYPGAGGAMAEAGGGSVVGGNAGPADFRTPIGGLNAFLAAVKAKDREGIVEATALRAPLEATERNKKFFASIADRSISDAAIAELAKQLEGYQISGNNDPKSTGRFSYILSKSNQQSGSFRRTITLRKEAKGWKVLDISGEAELQGFARPGARKPR